MASYAALLSLMHTLNNIKDHPHPPISFNQQQLHSLTQNLSFFQNFLERYSNKEDTGLEGRIADAAYAAEDVIEAHIVDEIDHAGSTNYSLDFYNCLEGVIQDMDFIKKEVMEIIIKEENTGSQSYDAVSTVSASSRQSSILAEFNDVLIVEVLDQLCGQQYNLQIISIDGMGGIGKTTFASNIYSHPLIVQHFDVLAWVTISQAYSRRQILLQILSQEDKGCEMSEDELGESVHKKLWGRRYFIVMDDIWSIEAFATFSRFFPDNNNGSRIMITTRLSNLALELSGSHVFHMKFLDEDKSWGLLCQTVFGKEFGCPVELENIGKEIARNCRGLPLSIVVIGGLLKKSNLTQAKWEYTLQNLTSLINLEDGEQCLQILSTSYKELPIYLKPCFLYMGVFPEDTAINVSILVMLWVAEGILRPIDGKGLEEVAEKYVNELIDRNLILVDELRWNGKAKQCKMHDLLRDLCIREAQKESFLFVLKHQQGLDIPHFMNKERRISIHRNTEVEYSPQLLHALESASLTRSLIPFMDLLKYVQLSSFELLRVIYSYRLSYDEDIFRRVNLRFLETSIKLPHLSTYSSSWFRFWNLQTLKVDIRYSLKPLAAPPEIWEMPLLRHVIIKDVQLPHILSGENYLILEDLHTLSRVCNFKLTTDVIQRIPNIKTLKLKYGVTDCLDYGLDNFGHLKELQSLNIFIDRSAILDGEIFQDYLVQNLSLPRSLKKLTLGGTMLNWDKFTTMIGSLPLLEFLRLNWNACCGAEWETVEGQFCRLKVLRIDGCCDLRNWITDNTHFPRLEHLRLRFLVELEEIPSSVGDIPTLKSIQLDRCSTSAADSATRIKLEQMELENTDLQLCIDGVTSDGQLTLTRSDALIYLREVLDTFKYQRDKYDQFLDVLKDFKALKIDTDDCVAAVKKMFKGYPNLILGFSIFLPKEFKITLNNDEEGYWMKKINLTKMKKIKENGRVKKTRLSRIKIKKVKLTWMYRSS